MNNISVFHKIKKHLKKDGFGGVIKAAWEAFLQRVYFKRYYWFNSVLDLGSSSLNPDNYPGRVEFRQLETITDWIKENIYKGSPYPDELYENRIAKENNHFFNCIIKDDKLISYIKIGINKIHLKNFNRDCVLADGESFVYAFYTDPLYRGKGLATYLLHSSMKDLRENGIKSISCHIRSNNIGSLKVFTKLNFKKFESNWQFKFFKINIFSKIPFNLCKFPHHTP